MHLRQRALEDEGLVEYRVALLVSLDIVNQKNLYANLLVTKLF